MTPEDSDKLLDYLIALSDRDEVLSFAHIDLEITAITVASAATGLLKLCRRQALPGFAIIEGGLEYDSSWPKHRALEMLVEHIDGLADIFEAGDDGPRFASSLDDESRERVVAYVDDHWDWRSRFHRMLIPSALDDSPS